MSPSGNSFAYGTVLELSEIEAQMGNQPRFILEQCLSLSLCIHSEDHTECELPTVAAMSLRKSAAAVV